MYQRTFRRLITEQDVFDEMKKAFAYDGHAYNPVVHSMLISIVDDWYLTNTELRDIELGTKYLENAIKKIEDRDERNA